MITLRMSDYNSIDTNPAHPIGEKAEYYNSSGQRCVLMYIKQIGATTSASGEWAAIASGGNYGEVSRTAASSLVDAVSTVGLPAGVFLAALATNKYGWIQVAGPGIAILSTDGGVAAGDPLVIDGGNTPVGGTDTMADGEEEAVCGWALTDDSAGSTQPAGSYVVKTIYAA